MKPSLISETRPTARKVYFCTWCDERIRPGDQHNRQLISVDGGFESNRFHPECFRAANSYFKLAKTDAFDAGSFERGNTVKKTPS